MSEFTLRFRFLDESKRNLTVTHNPTNISITSPDYFVAEKSDKQLKKEAWDVLKYALKRFESTPADGTKITTG